MIEPATAALADLNKAAAAAAEAGEALTQLDAIDLATLELAAAETETAWLELDNDLDRLNDRAAQLASVLANAKDAHRCRSEQATREQALAEAGDPAQLQELAEHLAQDLQAARGKVGELQAAHGLALARRGTAQDRLQRARQWLEKLDDLAGEPTCSRCGQPITSEHLERERRDASSEFEEATAQLTVEQAAVEELNASLTTAKNIVDDLDRRHRKADKAADTAQAARRELEHAAAQAKAAAQAATDVSRGTAEEPVVAVVTGGPLEEAERALFALRSVDDEARKLIEQIRKDRDKARTFARTAKQAFDDGQREHASLQNAASQRQQRARHLTEQAEIRLADLPLHIAAPIRARDDEILEQLQARLAELAGAHAALGQLETAEAELIGVSATINNVQDELAQIPPDQRIPLPQAQATLRQAEQNLKQTQEARDALRDEHNRLSEAHQVRAKLGKQLAACRQRSRIARRLAALLGRTQLQARLLTDATTGVEAYANDTLARISGCTLEIALRHQDKRGESSLDIFVNDRSSAQEPLEVAFISGSQKFRVAVALAAGLGQYIGGGTSIRSLIIDEGFGSLDADGRQRMIHELRTLAEHLDRVIVVSHQEDFSDRTLFPAEYVLRKDGTRTTVEKVM